MKAFINGNFISCEEKNRFFKVLVEDKGKIVFTGDTLPEKYNKAKKIDLKGRCVVPAFADTHMHFGSWALFNSTVDVRDAKNFDDLGKMLQDYMAKNPKAKFILAFGCTAHTVKERRLPERADLDKYINVPTMIVKYDGHAAVANSALINMFSDKVTKDVGFNAETGWLYQNAFYEGVNFVTAMVPLGKLLAGLISASNALAERGYGLIHTVEGVGFKNDMDVDSLQFLKFGFPSAYRIYFQTMDVDKVVKRKMTGIGGCFSLALDGCFGSEDAGLLEPYANDKDNYGFMPYTQEQVNDFCIKANRAGLQITMHAIGDAAIDMALNAYEAADKDFHRDDARHIIIHADLISDEQMDRAAKLKLIIAAQPEFLDWKQEPGEYLERILGKERVDKMLPFKSMVERGIIFTSGSDAPCTLPNPIVSLYNCCNHPNPAQSIDIETALKVLTSWAAYSGFDEKKRGMLKEGLIADMTVLNKNILKVKPKDIMSVKVEETYLAGKPVKKVRNGGDLFCKAIRNKQFKKEFK